MNSVCVVSFSFIFITVYFFLFFLSWLVLLFLLSTFLFSLYFSLLFTIFPLSSLLSPLSSLLSPLLSSPLIQEYQIAYVIIKTGNAPRPGVWSLEKSVDGGKTFKPWQYFADSASNCLKYFSITPLLIPVQDDTVLCSTEYSQVPPFENGEVRNVVLWLLEACWHSTDATFKVWFSAAWH